MKTNSIIKFIAGIFILILINILLSNNHTKWDLTKEKRHSISEESIDILKNIDDKIYITIYLDGSLPSQFEKLKKSTEHILHTFKSYSNKNIEFEFVNPLESEDKEKRDVMRKNLAENNIYPIWVKSKNKNITTTQITFPAANIHYNNKSMSVNLFYENYFYNNSEQDPYTIEQYDIQQSINKLEYNFIKSIHKICENNQKHIAFLSGNGELDSTNTFDIRNTLSEFYSVEYFDISMYEMDSVSGNLKIQEQLDRINKFDVAIISKPTEKFQNLDKFLIDQYIMNGGKVLCLLDGTDASMNNFTNGEISFPINKNNLNLDDLFENYGFNINNNLIQDLESTKIPITMGTGEIKYFDWVYNPIITLKSDHIISTSIDSILTDFSSNIEIINSEINSSVLLTSSKKSRLIYSGGEVSLDILSNPPQKNNFNKGEQIISVLLEGRFASQYKNTTISNTINFVSENNDGKMIVVSDGDIIGNKVNPPNFYFPLGFYKYNNSVFKGNKDFVLNSVQYLCDDKDLIKIRNKKKEKLRLLDSEKTDNNHSFIKLKNIIIPQIILLLIFFSFHYYRKIKYGK
ncbi:MAG: gliding motility-associated ABC transporter substrate-binding protein GldG [Flavobacteriales bacterium]|nr:gliding motility-associated ABC transporter substrate-binding protein GldG [Flavobacteriales bacterium]